MIKYPVAERALSKWVDTKLELLSKEGDSFHFRFVFLGSTCNNGGREFTAHLHSVVNDGSSALIIEKAWIEIPQEERENASHMCTVPGDSSVQDEEFYSNLAKPAKFAGRSLEDVILEEVPTNFAGCLCNDAIINQKWKMVLSTIHYQLQK